MILLILIKDDKTKFSLTSSTIYEVGDTTSNGWLVLEKRFYYRGSFLTLQELTNEYWEEFKFMIKKRHKKKISIFLKFGKKGK